MITPAVFSNARGRFSFPGRRTCAVLAWCALSSGGLVAAPGDVGPGWVLESLGGITEVPAEVISGRKSIKADYSGNASYQSYFRSDHAAVPLTAGRAYRVTFRYKILTQPDRGFEVLFLSPKAAAAGNFLPSRTLNGAAGTTGSAELTNTLGAYDDYSVRWNIVGRGAIAIDDIQLFDVATGAVLLAENAEGNAPSFRLAQSALPPAQVGRTFAVALAALGGRPPYTWRPGTLALPPGLTVDPDGHLSGKITAAGSFQFDALLTDANQATGRLSLRLTAAAADPLPPPPLLAIANNTVTVRPQPYLPAFRNPLGGMRPGLNSARSHPFASLGRHYIEWNLIENSAADTVEKIRAVTDRLVGDLPSYNIKIIPRVYLHWPNRGKYWPADLTADDYSSAAFRSRLQRLIARLGEAWDSDPCIAFIETGLIGSWGEHHSPSFLQLPAGLDAEFGDAFRNAFPNKKLMRRYPRDLTSYDFGTYWDVFGADRGGSGNDTTLMTRELESPLHLDSWKTSPRGGEIDPTFIGEPSFNTAGLQAVVRKHASRLVDLARRLHWNHLAVLDQVNRSDAELWDKASQIQNALGYRFVISEATHTAVVAPGGSLAINLRLTNVGSSAFHYPWPLEVALADARTRKVVWRTIWDGVDLRSWLPEVPINLSGDFALPADIAARQYVVTLAILDPGGLVPAARFAVNHYWMGGRTPLGPVAVGTSAPTAQLHEFDDQQTDFSLYYLAASDVAPAPPSNSRLSNLSILTSLDRPGDSFTLGYVVGGSGTSGAKPLVVRAAGPSLRPFGITNGVDDPKFDVFAQNQWLSGNDNWGGTEALARAMSAVGAFAFAGADSRDAAAVLTLSGGATTVDVSAVGNGTGTVLAEIYDATPAAELTSTTARLINVSALKPLGGGFALGFVVAGTAPKNVLIRAVGPTLQSAFGIEDAVGDPRLALHRGPSVLANNDNWGGTAALSSAFASVGAFALPGDSRDAAVHSSVLPGNYTVVVSDGGGATGRILVEVYELP